jgi:hypothetical protein
MAKARTAIDRKGWIAVFEAAATRKGDELNDEWRWLLEELGMTADSYPTLVEALGQGRWRDAKDPRAYVKTVAKREALREEIREKRNDILTIIPSSAGHPEFSVEGALDTLSYARETSETIQSADGIWRPGGAGERAYSEYYDEDDNGEPVSLRGRLRAKLPEGLLKSSSTPSNQGDLEEIDWRHVPIRVNLSEWATLAGFDAWEIQVMQYHLNGISRDRALAAQSDETSRKAIQAAWRKYDRTGKQRLKQVAEKMLAENVPDGTPRHTK